MKLATFYISITIQNYTKPLTVLEMKFKVKVMQCQTFFKILLMSAVICKQKLLHENETLQYI